MKKSTIGLLVLILVGIFYYFFFIDSKPKSQNFKPTLKMKEDDLKYKEYYKVFKSKRLARPLSEESKENYFLDDTTQLYWSEAVESGLKGEVDLLWEQSIQDCQDKAPEGEWYLPSFSELNSLIDNNKSIPFNMTGTIILSFIDDKQEIMRPMGFHMVENKASKYPSTNAPLYFYHCVSKAEKK